MANKSDFCKSCFPDGLLTEVVDGLVLASVAVVCTYCCLLLSESGRTAPQPLPAASPLIYQHSPCFLWHLTPLKYPSHANTPKGRFPPRVPRSKSCRCWQRSSGDEFAPLFLLWSETCCHLLGSSICFPGPYSLALQALIKVSLWVHLLPSVSSELAPACCKRGLVAPLNHKENPSSLARLWRVGERLPWSLAFLPRLI